MGLPWVLVLVRINAIIRFSALALVIAGVIAIGLMRATTALAAGVVTNCTGPNLGAAMNSGSGLITFNCNNNHDPATLSLIQAGGYNVITGNQYTIDGGNLITLTGADVNRLFYIWPGGALTLTNIVLMNGNSGADYGGAVFANHGRLVLDHATILNSHTTAKAGGAIIAFASPVVIRNNSLIQGNYGYDYGAVNSDTDLTVSDSVLRQNTALTGGGALSVGGLVTITNSAITGNATLNGGGGGLYIVPLSSVRIDASIVSSNSAPLNASYFGGGIYNQGALTITQTTLRDNLAGEGGALAQAFGIVNLDGITFTQNYAQLGGGFSNQAGGTAIVNHVLFYSNTASVGGGLHNFGILTLTQGTFRDNYVTGYGGGMRSFLPARSSLSAVTFSDNRASQYGAGFAGYRDLTDFQNVTFTNNVATLLPGGALSAQQDWVTLNNVTFDANSAPDGGAIYSTGALTLTNASLTNNQATQGQGGGLYVNSATRALIANSAIAANSAITNGGGIFSMGQLSLTQTTVNGNVAGQNGGGIYITNALILNASTLSGNTASTGYGGGVYLYAGQYAFISASTLISNGAGVRGGGIYSEGYLSVTQTALTGNSAGSAGAIDNAAGTEELNAVTLTGNQASAYGGALYNDGTLRLFNTNASGNSAYQGGVLYNVTDATLTGGTLSGNSASDNGGAILTKNPSTLALNNLTLSGNSSAAEGGGLYNDGNTTVNGTTFYTNTAAAGGAVYNNQIVRLTNSTLSGNASSGNGGAVYNGFRAQLFNATLANNAAAAGGAIYIVIANTTALTNTIVANSLSGGNCAGAGGITSKYTISSDGTCALSGSGDQINTNPKLTTLGNYGGPTQVHMLNTGSPAIDAIVGSDAPGTDQRGQPRPADGNGDTIVAFDIGAVERQPSDSTLVPTLYLPLLLR